MKTHTRFATSGQRADALMVFLPGAFLAAEEFERHGFVQAMRARHAAADALLVEADVSYFYDQSFVERLHEDVILPQRALGYTTIWIVGVSIGGFGALIHEMTRPGTVDGIVVLAPYLGRRPLGAEILRAGGLRAWKRPEGPPTDAELDRHLWPWLQAYASPEQAAGRPPLYLGFGREDRFAPNHRLLAEVLPEGQVFTTEGGHDWPQWAQLWRQMVEVMPLPTLPVARPLRLPAQVLPTMPAMPAAIAA